MALVAVLTHVTASILVGLSTARADAAPSLTALCGDQFCAQPCTGSEGPAAAASCIPAPAANATGPVIARDCYEHSVFGGECASCNVTGPCPDWCPEVRSAGCRPYEVICGYVETLEFQGPRADLVTRGPLFCRRVDCAEVAANAGASADDDVCWFAVDGHEICCIDGAPTYVTGSGQVVPGFGGGAVPAAAPGAALAPGGVESNGAQGLGRGLGGVGWISALVIGLAATAAHACAVGMFAV